MANILTGKIDLEYTRSEPLTGFHEKKTVPLDSPDNSIGIYQDGNGLHFKAVPNVDNETIEYTPDGKLQVVPAQRGRPPVDGSTIEYNANDELHVLVQVPPVDNTTIEINGAGEIAVTDGGIAEAKLEPALAAVIGSVADKANKIVNGGAVTITPIKDLHAGDLIENLTFDTAQEITGFDTGQILFDNGGLLSMGYDPVNGTERILYYLEGLIVTELWHENQGWLAPGFAVNDTIALMSIDPSITNAWELVTQSVTVGGSVEDLIDVKNLLAQNIADLAQSIADEETRATAVEAALDTKIDDTEADLAAAITQTETDLTAAITQTETNLTAAITQTETNLTAAITQTETDLTALITQTETNLTAAITQTETDLTALITQTESDLQAAKQDKSPADGVIYGLKDGGLEELTAGMFGVVNAVDNIPPNSAGNVSLNAAHRISIPDTNQGIGQTSVGETINTLFFDTAATPAVTGVDEYIEIERADGSTVFLRSKADGSFVFDDGAAETTLYSPTYGWQVSSQAVNGTLTSKTALSAGVWQATTRGIVYDLEDVYNAALLKAQANLPVVTSVVPRNHLNTTVLEENLVNLADGNVSQNIRHIPNANASYGGLMPASSFLAMAQALADIETLKGIGRIAAHMGLTPTQEELSNAWMAAKNSTSVPEGATAVNLDQEAPLGHSWTALDVSGTLQWFDRGTDVVNTATNAAPGVVKGDGAGNGKVAVEADGSMAVNGWDENVSNVQLSNITADTADFGTDAADSVPALLLIIAKKIRGLFSFFTNGAANIAVRLQTARSFQTNLASTAAASFDGSANVTPGVTGILPIANGGTGRTDGRSYMPAGIIVFTASYNPDAQRLVPLDGQTLTNAYVAGNQYYNLAQCFPSTTGGFVKSGNNLTLPNYQGLFLRGSGSQSITEYGFSGTHNGGNIGEKHGDAIREIFGEIDNNVVYGGGIRGTGAMRQYGYSHGTADSGSGAGFGGDVFNFYVSRVVPTDSTNHPAFGVGKICITY